MKALIVEDDPSHQYIFQLLTRRQGCISDLVTDGNQAVEMVKSNQYDLVILDIKLPNMDGYQVLDYLHTHEPGLLRHTLVVSAINKRTLETLGQRYDVPVVTKPFNLEELSDSIRDVLHRAGVRSVSGLGSANPPPKF